MKLRGILSQGPLHSLLDEETGRHHLANDWGVEIYWGEASVQGVEILRGEEIAGAKNLPFLEKLE